MLEPLLIGLSPVVRDGVKGAINSYLRRNRGEPTGDIVIKPVPAEFTLDVGTPTITMSASAISDRVNDELSDFRRAQLILFARTQYGFYAVFQVLVVVLAVAAAVALVVCIVRLVAGDPDLIGVVADVGIGVSGLVTGGAATFIQTQASDAKDRYLEALKLLED